MANLFKIENYENDIDIFLSGFLRRKLTKSSYTDIFLDFIKTGEILHLNELIELIDFGLLNSIKKKWTKLLVISFGKSNVRKI